MNHNGLTFTFLAQDAAPSAVPPSPGEAVNAPATTGVASGASGTLPPPPAGPLGGNSFMLLLVGAVVLMLVFSLFRQNRDNKKRQAMLSAIKKHDRVQTIGGVLGSVVEAKSDYVILKVDESSNTRITFARSAIQQVISQAPETAAAASDVADK